MRGGGGLLYAEVPFADGMGHLEIALRGRGREPVVTYVERVAGEEVFVAERVMGLVEVPVVVLDGDGRLQLLLLLGAIVWDLRRRAQSLVAAASFDTSGVTAARKRSDHEHGRFDSGSSRTRRVCERA